MDTPENINGCHD